MAKDIILAAGFVASGVGATGLTVTVDVWRVTLADLSASEVVTAGSATEIGDGLYAYRVASADLQTYYYYAVFKTAGTADVKHLFGAQLDFSGNTGDSYARLGAPAGASVSADIAALPSASTIATAVWAAATRTLTSISALAASIASAVLDATASSYNTTDTIGSKINSAAATSGSGASTYTMTINDVNNNALDGVEVWVTSDLAGNSIVASGTTNGVGVVTFQLDPATYYVWCQESGQNFTNPSTITVT